MKKSAHYRHCQWLQDESLILRTVLDDTFDAIVGPDGFADYQVGPGLRCIVVRRDAGQNQSYFHFIIYEQGSCAAVVSLVNTDLAEVDPPDDSEFIESQLFLLVRGNNALYTTHNKALRDGSVNGTVLNFVGQHFGEPECQFHLMPEFNEAQLQTVFDDGIDHIDLSLGSFAETIESLKHGGRIPEGSILDGLREFFGNHNDPDDDRAAAKVKARIKLMPSRSWDHRDVKSYLSSFAMSVTEDHDEGFTIVTKSGVRVTHKKITVKEDMEVAGTSRLLNSDDIIHGLRAAMRALHDNHILG